MSPVITSSSTVPDGESAHATIPTTHEREATAAPRRRRRGWVVLWILLAIAILFQFNPLHPIAWWEEQKDQIRQGWEAAGRDKAEAAARARRKAAQESNQTTQHPTPSPTPMTTR
ncbi:MAG TPA: hypothetical protein VNU46_02935 [Gemmatimonadaceae bacterium]|jgi:hypothetical protein|nr:hypothetical protein [Gemmatimonadaceae bacterium]